MIAKIQDFFSDFLALVDDGAAVNHGDGVAWRSVFERFERHAAFEKRHDKRRLALANAFNHVKVFRILDVDLKEIGGVLGISCGKRAKTEICHGLPLRKKKDAGRCKT